MLTHRHLAVLRAALLFFEEEIVPHSADIARPYFDPPLEPDLQADEVQQLRNLLQVCRLQYANYDQSRQSLLSLPLWKTAEAARSSPSTGPRQIAAVLLFPVS